MKNEIELLTQLVRDGKIKKGDIPEDHYNEIMKKHGISSKGTISYICNHEYMF